MILNPVYIKSGDNAIQETMTFADITIDISDSSDAKMSFTCQNLIDWDKPMVCGWMYYQSGGFNVGYAAHKEDGNAALCICNGSINGNYKETTIDCTNDVESGSSEITIHFGENKTIAGANSLYFSVSRLEIMYVKAS